MTPIPKKSNSVGQVSRDLMIAADWSAGLRQVRAETRAKIRASKSPGQKSALEHRMSALQELEREAVVIARARLRAKGVNV